MSERSETALSHFRQGFNCAQSVLVAFAVEHALDPELAVRMAAPFGGGVGRMGELCGALTGGLMALGLCSGCTTADPKEKERGYHLARKFVERFREANGALLCRDLLGYDISNPVALAEARRHGRFASTCPIAVESAVRILDGMI